LLMLTSAGQRGDGERCRELGIRGYLTKPLSRPDLLEALGTVLAGPPEEAGTPDVVTRHTIAESRHSLRVLLAEDNPVNQQVAVGRAGALSGAGYDGLSREAIQGARAVRDGRATGPGRDGGRGAGAGRRPQCATSRGPRGIPLDVARSGRRTGVILDPRHVPPTGARSTRGARGGGGHRNRGGNFARGARVPGRRGDHRCRYARR